MPLKIYQEESGHPLSAVKHIIAVAAGKGGVGKSSVAVNLALALKQLDFNVGLMDTDIYGPSIRKMLPEDSLPSQQGTVIHPALCQGVRVISMAYFRKEHEAAVIRAPIANGIIKQFIQNIAWGPLDYLIIDFPPGTGDIQLTLSQEANLTGALMVTTPQDVAVIDVRKAIHMFEQVKVPIIGIVENMSYYRHPATEETVYLFGKGGGERLAQEMGVPLLETIPIDPFLCMSGDNGQSIFSKNKPEAASITQVFTRLAKRLVAQIDIMNQINQPQSHFEINWKEIQ